ncbi:MAG: GHKL domain-containing protein [Flavobacteriales bacterium]|nr:Adaptive-response sensory-kinase SasA [Flavobacteriales bacterium]MCC6576128.1 GHKL domain-containing protein [Flavobacteriales bacterium]NUQ14874.1 GHKL domain-containing protein [Flavobacteriales bacterium]
MRRILLPLVAGLFLCLVPWWVPGPSEDSALEHRAGRLQRRVAQAEAELKTRVEGFAAEAAREPVEIVAAREGSTLVMLAEQEGIELYVLRNDRMVWWTGRAPVERTDLLHGHAAHMRLPDGIYLHALVRQGDLQVHGLRQVWYAPPIENRYLERGFHPALAAPAGVWAEVGPGLGPVIRDGQGAVMFRAVTGGDVAQGAGWPLARSLAVAVGLVLLILTTWRLAVRVQRDHGPWAGATLFPVVLLVLRWAGISFGNLPDQGLFRVFDPGLYASSAWLPSLGDLLIHAVFLVLVAAYLRIAFREPLPPQGRAGRLGTVLLPLALLLAADMLTNIVQGLVSDSRIELDLRHIEAFDRYSFLALGAVALLFAAWCLLADLWARLVHRQTLAHNTIGLAIAFVLNLALRWPSAPPGLLEAFWSLPLLALALSLRTRRPGFTEAVLALSVIAALCAQVIARAVDAREERTRQAVAERLLTQEDPVVELLFREVAPSLRTDPALYRLLTDTAVCTAADLDRTVRQERFTGYWERYDVRLFAYGTDGRLRCATDAALPTAGTGPLTQGLRVLAAADMPDLHQSTDEAGRTYRHARLAIMPADTLEPAQLVLELHPRLVPEGLGFPELLLAGRDPLDQRVDRYDWGRYEDGQLVEQTGAGPLPVRWDSLRTPQGVRAYGDPVRSLVVLRVPPARWLDRATGFSYLFAFLSLMLGLAIVVRALVRNQGLPGLTIAGKVRLALVGFSLLGLVFFGLGARRLLERSYEERSTAALLEKTRSVHAELQRRLDGAGPLKGSTDAYLDHLLGRLSNVFFTDIHVYRRDGRLLSSSRPQLFNAGLLGRRMDPAAYLKVVLGGANAYVHDESLGRALHRTAYMPLRDDQGVLLGFLGLPSFADQALQDRERASVLVAVVNLFVLFFALSVGVAVFISNWTARPLDRLKESLARVALTGANVPLRYRGEDEVGRLVEVYNRKVEELRASAEKLARSERESAWREMARQVAHEIKNPLTPMKLSIQQFQRSWDPAAPDARERLEKLSAGLVQQIDALNGVATAFGQFAQMPPARPEPLDLREVLRAATAVFQATPGTTITVPEPPELPVMADREHMLRVLNNLLKNAVQAIPDGRPGRIEVVAFRSGDRAVVEVRDNGTGIAEEVRERIFTPSFTTKGSGMGLGLAMVKRMVEQAGGSVSFSTNVDEGTTFSITIPLTR